MALWLLALTLIGTAHADNPARWAGLPLAGVQLEAPEGGLPEESLLPLLRSIQGEDLDLGEVRLDLATLYRVGAFRTVEAQAMPWVTWNALGEPEEAVLLTYLVYPAPRIGKVRVAGNKQLSDREVEALANLEVGQGTWFPELESERVSAAVEAGMYRLGWIEADVMVEALPMDDGELEVRVLVTEGNPNLLESLTFAGDLSDLPPGIERSMRRWAKKQGIAPGKPFAPEAVNRTQSAIRSQLAVMSPGLFRKRRGWIDARVTPALARTGTGAARLTFTIEPGDQLELEVSGLGARGRRSVQAALGIDERLRLTRGFVEEAPDRLRASLQDQGYHEATVSLTLDEPNPQNRVRVLRIDAERGRRHTLPAGGYPGFLGIEFQDNAAVSDADLQRVIDESSPDVIRRDFYSVNQLERGLLACRELYRARGYLDANLELVDTLIEPRGWLPVRVLLFPFRALLRRPPPVLAIPEVRVSEGPQTTLSNVRLVGAAPDVDLDALQLELDGLEGSAFSAQVLESLTRRAVEAHRAAGYLEVDAWVDTLVAGPLERSARLVLEPGPQVLLRSKVTRGLRRSNAVFIKREAEITLGEPITTAAIEQIRSNLYELGTFRSVQVQMLGDGANRDLVIDVLERPRWAYEWGFGLSTDDGVRSFARVTRRNLWGRAHRLDITARVGLLYGADGPVWLPDINNPEWRLGVTYTAPRVPTRSQESIADVVLRERRLERTWRMDRSGAGLALESRPWAGASLRTGVRLETRQLREVDTGALLPGDPWLELIGVELPSRWRVQEQIIALYLHDRRDNQVLPTRGWLAQATAELAPGLPWDDWRPQGQPVTAFAKAQAKLTSWIPLGGFSLKLSGAGGHARSLNQGVIPLEDRFRLGGTNSLRGFRRDAVGPRQLSPRIDVDWPSALTPVVTYATRDNPEIWVPTGGDTSALGTVELLLPLPSLGLPSWEGYSAALFADAGNVWLASPYTEATSQEEPWASLLPVLRYAVGAGMRMATPVGPLQIDVAVNPQRLTATGALEGLLVTGYEEPSWRAHLTLGSLF